MTRQNIVTCFMPSFTLMPGFVMQHIMYFVWQMPHFKIPKTAFFFNNILIIQIICVSKCNWQLIQNLAPITVYHILKLLDTIIFDML